MKKVISAIIVVLAITAGCGGSDAASEILDNQRKIVAAVQESNYAKVCSYYTARFKCLGEFAAAEALLGDDSVTDLLTEKEMQKVEDKLDNSKVKVNGDRATVTVEGSPEEVWDWIKIDGEWKLVWPEDE